MRFKNENGKYFLDGEEFKVTDFCSRINPGNLPVFIIGNHAFHARSTDDVATVNQILLSVPEIGRIAIHEHAEVLLEWPSKVSGKHDISELQKQVRQTFLESSPELPQAINEKGQRYDNYGLN